MPWWCDRERADTSLIRPPKCSIQVDCSSTLQNGYFPEQLFERDPPAVPSGTASGSERTSMQNGDSSIQHPVSVWTEVHNPARECYLTSPRILGRGIISTDNERGLTIHEHNHDHAHKQTRLGFANAVTDLCESKVVAAPRSQRFRSLD